MLMNGTSQWHLLTLLLPERQCHLSQMHSKKGNCLSKCDSGDYQSMQCSTVPLPYSTGTPLYLLHFYLLMARISKTLVFELQLLTKTYGNHTLSFSPSVVLRKCFFLIEYPVACSLSFLLSCSPSPLSLIKTPFPLQHQ